MIKFIDGLRDFISVGKPNANSKVYEADIKKGYQRHQSFTNYLPWIDLFGDKQQYVLLEDAQSLGIMYELSSLPCDGNTFEQLEEVVHNLQSLVAESVKNTSMQGRWSSQIMITKDKVSFQDVPKQMLNYALGKQKKQSVSDLHPFTTTYINDIVSNHISDLAQEGGLFVDSETSLPWGGNKISIVLTLYRRNSSKNKKTSNLKELELASERLEMRMRKAKLYFSVITGDDIRKLLIKWLNPKPAKTKGNLKQYIDQLPSIIDEKPLGWSLADDVCSSNIKSTEDTWLFDNLYHKAVTVEHMRTIPDVGEFTLDFGNGSIIDNMPDGTRIVINWSVLPDLETDKILNKLEKKAQANNIEAAQARDSIDEARVNISNGGKVINYNIGICLVADSQEQMTSHLSQVENYLDKFSIYPPENDQFALSSYLRYLPFAYNPEYEDIKIRAGMIYSEHLAKILPIFGGSQGTDNYGITFYNRAGELVACDPLVMGDRVQNAHLFLFGPTGAGKSATLNYLMMHYAAIWNPRIIVVEAGNSFGLLMQYFAEQSYKTKDIVLRPDTDATFPVFAGYKNLLDADGNFNDSSKFAEKEQDEVQDQRNYLGEFEVKVRLMITGGRKVEEDKFSRADEGFIKNSIIKAAEYCYKNNKELTVSTYINYINKNINKLVNVVEGADISAIKARVGQMTLAMGIFTQGFEGQLFNQPQPSWDSTVDIARIEMGTLANTGYEDKLALAYIGLINEVMNMAESNQRDGRPTIFLTDEGHAISTNPLTAAYKVLISKLTGRRLGMWIWDATQNMADYPDEAEKMLAMFEWWVCLMVGRKELQELERFKELTEEERNMVLSTRKSPRQYTEGVVMSPKISMLFRNVPPALSLALAGTEKDEKTARAELMDKHNCTELDAARMIAEQIAKGRRIKK